MGTAAMKIAQALGFDDGSFFVVTILILLAYFGFRKFAAWMKW